jgi:zinc protease
VRAARLDAVRAFHARFYGAEHAELAVVGDFDADAVVKLATELFGDWKSGAAYARVPYPYQATVPGTEVIATPEKANASLIGNLALPVRDTSPDFPALAVVDKLLGGGPESRLGDRVRERGGLSYSVGTALSPGNIDENSRWMIYATFAPENRDKVRAAVAEELARAVKDGFTPAEEAKQLPIPEMQFNDVETAKRALLELRRNSRAQDGAVVRGLMSQAYLDRSWAFSAETDRALAALTAERVNAALRKYLKPDGFWTAEAGDFAKVRK